MTNWKRFKNIIVQKSLIFFYDRINKGILFNTYIRILKITKLFKSNLDINKKVIKDFKNPFFLSRKSRFYMYSDGLNNRLEHLFNEYLLNQIKFNDNDLIIDCGANIGELGYYLNYKFGIKNLLFLGSSCIYPSKSRQPIKEDYLLTGELEKTNDAYALAKISGLKLCQYLKEKYDVNYKPLGIILKNKSNDPQNWEGVCSKCQK